MNTIKTKVYESPCGALLLGAFEGRLCLCNWIEDKHPGSIERRIARGLHAEFEDADRLLADKNVPVRQICSSLPTGRVSFNGNSSSRAADAETAANPEDDYEVLDKAVRELDEYFAGARRDFDIPLLFVGTEFQKKVWAELMKIPYGRTISYGEQAKRIGMPKAVRAVANANGANAISIFAPCHRVIGSNGTLTGFGGGLDAKHALLSIEKQL